MFLNQYTEQLWQKYQANGADSVIKKIINTSNSKPVSGSSYLKLLKELNHSRKDLINIRNTDDSGCLK